MWNGEREEERERKRMSLYDKYKLNCLLLYVVFKQLAETMQFEVFVSFFIRIFLFVRGILKTFILNLRFCDIAA